MRRYESAAEFAADLERLLRSEPIKARAAGHLYRMSRYMRRKQKSILAGGLLAAALILGMGIKEFIRRPAVEASAASPQVDLSNFYNISLEGSGRWQLDSAVHPLQQHPQKFGDVLFEIGGGIRLASPHPFYANLPVPSRVVGIPIRQKCEQLHFLHFVFRARDGEDNGLTVLKYVLHFADGGKHEVPVQYGQHVRTWTSYNGIGGSADPNESVGDPNSAIVWRGTNNGRFRVRLFRTTWPNPRPNIQISSIDLVSAMTDYSPVVVAITAEK